MSRSDTAQTAPVKGCLSPDRIEMLVVHCSDTPDDDPIGAMEIQEMHLGFGWDGIGYHQVIRRDGTREAGRPEYWQGAHVKGVNDRSLSVCLIGRNEFTEAQMNSLAALLFDWTARYPDARVLGHRDAAETHKTCPNFDAAAWWEDHKANKAADTASVAVPIIGITAEPAPGQPLETEALYGEALELLERRQGYARVRLATDGYVGWVPIGDNLQTMAAPTHRIAGAATFVLSEPSVKSSPLLRLTMGALIEVTGSRDGWHQVNLPRGTAGFVASHAAIAVGRRDSDDAVTVAERLTGAPYLWGGRSASGLDCSALVQLALQAAGMPAPRNSGDQLAWAESRSRRIALDAEPTQRGDLVFWPGHVGLCQSADRIIHANAFHHAVASEPLESALARIDQDTGQAAMFLRLPDQPF